MRRRSHYIRYSALSKQLSHKVYEIFTLLDYTALEARGRSIEAKLSEKDKELYAMKQKIWARYTDDPGRDQSTIQSDYLNDTA